MGAGGLPVGVDPEEGDAESCVYENKPAYEGEVEAEEVHLVAPHHRHALVDGAVSVAHVGVVVEDVWGEGVGIVFDDARYYEQVGPQACIDGL